MNKIWLLILGIGLFFSTLESQACTLWGIAGDSVKDGGTIICKNRDQVPDHQQRLQLIENARGYCYLSLSGNGTSPKAGVNERGLAVVNAAPPAQLAARENFQGRRDTAYLLSRFASVNEAILELANGHWSFGSGSLILADRYGVVNIEFGLKGSYSINSCIKSGAVYQTNHYLSEFLQPYNRGNLGTSIIRYNRIKALLETQKIFNLEDCINISNDSVLWRPGGVKPNSVRTMASWILWQRADGNGQLYLKMANPGKPVKEYQFNLKDIFAKKVDLSIIE